jgi:hypothetical protein
MGQQLQAQACRLGLRGGAHEAQVAAQVRGCSPKVAQLHAQASEVTQGQSGTVAVFASAFADQGSLELQPRVVQQALVLQDLAKGVEDPPQIRLRRQRFEALEQCDATVQGAGGAIERVV